MNSKKRVAVIGGGTGSFTLLTGLKEYDIEITALVNMSDDGGSTGVLSDELGVLPAGDVRQCLVALSDVEELRDLVNYRFSEGGLSGHSFGNILLAALEKVSGSFLEAVELASRILRIKGVVEPINLDKITLCMDDGSQEVTKSEHAIGHAIFTKPRPKLWLEPASSANPAAVVAILEADLVVIAPGSLYGSLAPALIVPGIGQALHETHAKVAYVCNLATKEGQTDNFAVHDFAQEIERFTGYEDCLDYVLYNTEEAPESLLNKYAAAGENMVKFGGPESETSESTYIGADLLALNGGPERAKGDAIAHKRSYIRHDPHKVAKELIQLISA